MSAADGEALLEAAEDLAGLVLQTDWTAQDQQQLRDQARLVMAIINDIGGRPRER